MSKASALGWLFFLLLVVCKLVSGDPLPRDPASVAALAACGTVVVYSLVVVVVVGRQNKRAARYLRDLRRDLAEAQRRDLEARRAAATRLPVHPARPTGATGQSCGGCGAAIATPTSERSV